MINLQTLTWAVATEAKHHNRKIRVQKVGTVILLRTVILGTFAVRERESFKKNTKDPCYENVVFLPSVWFTAMRGGKGGTVAVGGSYLIIRRSSNVNIHYSD